MSVPAEPIGMSAEVGAESLALGTRQAFDLKRGAAGLLFDERPQKRVTDNQMSNAHSLRLWRKAQEGPSWYRAERRRRCAMKAMPHHRGGHPLRRSGPARALTGMVGRCEFRLQRRHPSAEPLSQHPR